MRYYIFLLLGPTEAGASSAEARWPSNRSESAQVRSVFCGTLGASATRQASSSPDITSSDLSSWDASSSVMPPARVSRPLRVRLSASNQLLLMAQATEDSVSLFNGRDLGQWVGDPLRWKVQQGALTGRVPRNGNRIETPTPEHGDSNEKAQNHGTHLAGRSDPALRR
jgi:hypothetical protein